MDKLIVLTSQELENLLRGVVRSEVDDLRRDYQKKHPARTEYMTVKQAADYMSMSTAGVRRWIGEGYLPAKSHGKVLRVTRKDCDSLLTAHRQRTPNMAALAPGAFKKAMVKQPKGTKRGTK